MSSTSTPDPGAGAPLTRRQRRALERAQEMAQQAQQDAQTEHLPALPQSPAAAQAVSRPVPSSHTGPAAGRPPVAVSPPKEGPRPWQPTDHGAAASRRTETNDRSDHSEDRTGGRGDDAGGPDRVGEEWADVACSAEAAQPRRTLGGPFGRMPRGPLAIALIGIVILAMFLVPLAVNKFVTGRSGSGISTVAQSTVLDGNAPLKQLMTISGRLGSGSAPSVALNHDASLSAPSSVITDVVETGQGRVVSEGSPVVLQVSQFSGLDGRNTTDNPEGYTLWKGTLGVAEVGADVDAAVSGQREGTRVVLRAPTEEKDGSKTTEITVVDILPTTATGETQEPAAGTPTVTEGADGSITVSSAGLPAPTRAATAVLIKGTGPQIRPQDRLIARSTMVSWATGQTLGESYFGYQKAPETLDMSNALVGVSQNLVDIAVGSRVVLSLPAEQAQGTEPVVVVIDVLAIDPAKAPRSAGAQSSAPTASPQPSASPHPTTQDNS